MARQTESDPVTIFAWGPTDTARHDRPQGGNQLAQRPNTLTRLNEPSKAIIAIKERDVSLV
ncbi:hypothetical protein MOKP76_47360 [Mycobacterium avium subsp. hominissuis]